MIVLVRERQYLSDQSLGKFKWHIICIVRCVSPFDHVSLTSALLTSLSFVTFMNCSQWKWNWLLFLNDKIILIITVLMRPNTDIIWRAYTVRQISTCKKSFLAPDLLLEFNMPEVWKTKEMFLIWLKIKSRISYKIKFH